MRPAFLAGILGSILAPSSIRGLPANSAIGMWFADQYDSTRKQIPNAASSAPQNNIVTRNHRGLFTTGKAPGAGTGGGWLGGDFDGMTVTEKYAANIAGQTMATRVVLASTANGLRYRTNPTVAAGTYTMVIQARSNTGANQDFLMSRNGGTNTVSNTATTAWQTFTLEFTVGSSTALDLRFLKPTSGSGDFVIDNAFLWRGAASTLPAVFTWGGHLCVSENDTEAVSCTSGELALTSTQAAYMTFDAAQSGVAFSIYAVVKRISTYTTAGAGRYPFFFLPQESGSYGITQPTLALGEYDAENYLTGSFGSAGGVKGGFARKAAIFPNGDAPALFADGGYHVLSMKVSGTGNNNANTGEVWLDDCVLFNNITTITNTEINWFLAAIGGNNGLSRHKVNSLSVYAKRHTTLETRQTVAALISVANASALSVTPPKNIIIAEGDSITVGPASNSYVQQSLSNLIGTGLFAINFSAQPGSMLNTHLTTGLNVTDRLTAFHLGGVPLSLAGRRMIYSVLIGANDLSTIGNASAYLASLYSVTDQMRSLGCKVIICTVLPKSSAWPQYALHNSLRATLNTQLRLDVVGGGGANKFDALADFAADIIMGPDMAASNTIYYSDGLHPTAAGHTVLEPIWRGAVNGLLV